MLKHFCSNTFCTDYLKLHAVNAISKGTIKANFASFLQTLFLRNNIKDEPHKRFYFGILFSVVFIVCTFLLWLYRVRRENDYNYISLYHPDLGGCRGQNSFAISEYMPKLLEKPWNIFVLIHSKKWLIFLSDRVEISHAHLMK